ncbi:MAG: glycosyltransferase family 2 protein [Polaromonas sp.]|jgi:GT2 family glycosyltransferase
MKISFIVLTYNRTDALLAVLRSLARQCGTDHEVLVADDGSSPAQVDMLRRHCPPFNCPTRHVWHPDKGFTAAKARNLGAHHAVGEYLVFLDGDCVPGRSFVKAQTRLAERGCFVNGSRVLLSEQLTLRVVNQEIDLLDQSWFFWILARLKGDSNKLLHMLGWSMSWFRVQAGFRWKGIRSCNLAVWRNDFLAVNGFDETFEGWGHEDADLVLRLSNAGVQRKNGFWATEVYHLWHREQQRHQESVNRLKVLDRMKTFQTRAAKGCSEIEPQSSGQVTHLQ